MISCMRKILVSQLILFITHRKHKISSGLHIYLTCLFNLGLIFLNKYQNIYQIMFFKNDFKNYVPLINIK